MLRPGLAVLDRLLELAGNVFRLIKGIEGRQVQTYNPSALLSYFAGDLRVSVKSQLSSEPFLNPELQLRLRIWLQLQNSVCCLTRHMCALTGMSLVSPWAGVVHRSAVDSEDLRKSRAHDCVGRSDKAERKLTPLTR